MKKLRALQTALAFCLLLCFCKKDETLHPTPLPEYVPIHSPCDTSSGFASANKLTAAWKAGATCRSYFDSGKKYWLLELTTCAADGSMRENLIFGGMPDLNIVQQFKIIQPAVWIPQGTVGVAYGTLIDDGDVAEDYYYVDTTIMDNYLTIDRWDVEAKRVEGRFNVSFDIREPRRSIINPKKVTFSSGKFWAKLPE